MCCFFVLQTQCHCTAQPCLQRTASHRFKGEEQKKEHRCAHMWRLFAKHLGKFYMLLGSSEQRWSEGMAMAHAQETKMQFARSVWCTWSSLTTLQGSVWETSATWGHLWKQCTTATTRDNLVWGHCQPVEVSRVGFFPSVRKSSWASWTRSSVSLPACFQKCCLYCTDTVYVE